MCSVGGKPTEAKVRTSPRNDWFMRAVDKRLREELAKPRVEINEDKSRTIDLTKGGSFAFLGFEYRRVLGRNQKWRPQFVHKMKKRTALFAKLREVFRQHVSQPVGEVIEEINPILRGWMNYFQDRSFESMFFEDQRLGRNEDPAASDAIQTA